MSEVNLLPPVLSPANFGAPSSSFTNSEHQRRLSNTSSSDPSVKNPPPFDPEKAFGDSGRRGSRSASDASQRSAGSREEIKKAVGTKEGGLGETVEEEEDSSTSPTLPADASNPPQDPISQTAPLAIKVKRVVESSQMALTPGLDSAPFKWDTK